MITKLSQLYYTAKHRPMEPRDSLFINKGDCTVEELLHNVLIFYVQNTCTYLYIINRIFVRFVFTLV